MIKTRAEIYELKRSWEKDPCWDIEETEGFEEHKEELLAFRIQAESFLADRVEKQLAARLERMAKDTGITNPMTASYLSTFDEIETNLRRLDSQIGDAGSAAAYCQYAVLREQVRATLLMAAQIQRVANMLEGVTRSDSINVYDVKN